MFTVPGVSGPRTDYKWSGKFSSEAFFLECKETILTPIVRSRLMLYRLFLRQYRMSFLG